MPLARRGLLAALVATLVVAGAVEPVVATDREPVVRSDTSTAIAHENGGHGDGINVTQSFALTPDRPGEVRVTVRFSIPDRVRTLNTTVPSEATVTGVDGFDRRSSTGYRWGGSTNAPSITYRLPVNRTVNRTSPEGADGQYLYVDAGEWALFVRPRMPTNWTYTGSERLPYRMQTTADGPGATGEWLVYLGDHELRERQAHDQRFRFVVPDRADPAVPPEETLDAMANASDALRIGDRDDEVFIIAAPTGDVEWGVRGLQTGDADMWVRDTERLNAADNVWLHEYVHTRQRFRSTSETRWLYEGTAVYYAALLSLEQDRIGFDAFERRLSEGEQEVYDEIELSNVSTWRAHPDYNRGALIAGRLDRAIRLSTDNERTFQDVLRRINARDAPLTQVDLLTLLGEVGGTDILEAGQRYTQESGSVTMWGPADHSRAFGQLPPRIGYGLPPIEDGSGYRTVGPYRYESVGGENPIRLVTGEEFVVDARVNNSGGTGGDYAVPLAVNGTVVTWSNGTIRPGESRTIRLNHTFVTPGRYEVGVDGETVTVLVRRPASARVTGLAVSPDVAQQGENVTAIATVTNNASRPGRTTVVFTRDYRPVAQRTVTLPANASRDLEVSIRLPDAGTTTIAAGSARPVEIPVEPAREGGETGIETPSPTTTEPGSTSASVSAGASPTASTVDRTTTDRPTSVGATTEDGPGFGVPILAGAVLVLLLLGSGRP